MHYEIIKNGYRLYSPNRSVQVDVTCDKGMLYYEARKDGKVKYRKSKLGISIGKTDKAATDYTFGNEIAKISEREIKGRTFQVYGRRERREENSVRYEIGVKGTGCEYRLEFAVFDDGVAFRYVFPESAGSFVFGEYTEFKLAKGSKVYASFGCRHPGCNAALNGRDTLCYECTYAEYDPAKKFIPNDYEIERDYWGYQGQKYERFYDYVLMPMSVRFADGTYGAILESDVIDYYGSNLRPYGHYRFGLNTAHGGKQFEVFQTSGAVKTPMRVLLLEKDLDGLYNNSIENAVVKQADGDFSFVKPGKCTWHWHAEIVQNHRIDYAMCKEYTLAAIKLGFEYNIIDDGWLNFSQEANGKTYRAEDLLKIICETSAKYGVKQICWGGYLGGQLNPESFSEKGDCAMSTKEFIDLVYDCGAAGAKIDFFRGEHHMIGGVNMYETILEYGKDKKMVFNFHGATKPTGQSAKYPNELSREAIKGMENYFYSPMSYKKIAYGFTTLTFVRGIAGHGDWTPFVQDGIGLATMVLTDSPMNAVSATTSDLLDHPAKEWIKSLPSSFDSTHVLPESKFGEYVAMVKEKDGTFFVGGINNSGKTYLHKVNLEKYMPKDSTYQAEIWFDTPSGLRCEKQLISAYDTIPVEVPDGRGFVMRISRMQFNYYGGEATEDVKIYSCDSKEIYYTLDDSDPMTSNTRKEYRGGVKIEKSCYLTACLVKDGEQIAKLRHRFNVLPQGDIFEV